MNRSEVMDIAVGSSGTPPCISGSLGALLVLQRSPTRNWCQRLLFHTQEVSYAPADIEHMSLFIQVQEAANSLLRALTRALMPKSRRAPRQPACPIPAHPKFSSETPRGIKRQQVVRIPSFRPFVTPALLRFFVPPTLPLPCIILAADCCH